MTTQVLQINKLSIGYGKGQKGKVIANDLQASMHSGELICLLGENGAGKSTLIRTLCGFQPPLKGSVDLLGRNLFSFKGKELSRLAAVVLTDRVVVVNATVEELVGLGRSPYTGALGVLNEADKYIVNQAIEKCGIRHKQKTALSTLSDGERQKAFIAKALAQDTPLLFLDEPTAFLDLSARVEIIKLLREIASSSSKSILMSTHDMDLAIQMADKIWLMIPGGPIIAGSPEDLLLTNSFRKIFSNQRIELDNRTGLFKVAHQHWTELSVKGHGFEYVLLRRAFARQGIKVEGNQDSAIFVEINKNCPKPFLLKNEAKIIAEECSVELIVKKTVEVLKASKN